MIELDVKFAPVSKHAKLPTYATEGSAGCDLYAAESIVLQPGQRHLISCGFKMQFPEGYEAQVRPRSGLALKHGITVLNSPGTIDSDYRGIVGVILYNANKEVRTVNVGDRVAQMVFAPVVRATFQECAELDSSDRGEGGFGSTGT